MAHEIEIRKGSEHIAHSHLGLSIVRCGNGERALRAGHVQTSNVIDLSLVK